MFFTLTDRASTTLSNIRGCQSGTWSAGQKKIRGIYTKHQRLHENKTKQKQDKNDKKKETVTQSTRQKKIGEGLSIERVWYSASREPSDNLPGSQPCTQTHSIYNNSVLSGFRLFLYRHSRCRLGSPWVGPINTALNRLKLATVTPGAISTLSTYFASLFPCRCSDAFSSSFNHSAINLQPPSRTTVPCRLQGGSSAAAVFQSPVMPKSRRSSASQSIHCFSFFPAHISSRSPTLPTG